MYAYIINTAWQQWPNKDIGSFLREIGTPVLKHDINDPDPFLNASGFYVYVEKGWTVRFDPQIGSQLNFTNGLSSMLDSMHI